MLELAILGLLKEQPLHGYELKKRLSEMLGPFSGASFGSLYPALRRLEAAGAVEAVEAPPEHRSVPMTGSLGGELAAYAARRRAAGGAKGGRTRRVYGITQSGQQLFEDLLTTESASTADERTFNLKLAFARHLPPAGRVSLLERRRAQLVQRLSEARSSAKTRRSLIDAYTRSVLEHSRETIERDISWLDQLIEIEKGSVK